MPSKKGSVRAIHVVAFLLVTIGIVFLLLRVRKSYREGFQEYDASTTCNPITVAGRTTFLCPTYAAMETLMATASDTVGPDDAVCYTDSNSTDLTGKNATFYTCLDRPTPFVMDTERGIKREISPLEGEDEQPDLQIQSIKANCGAYQGAFTQIMNSYGRTNTIISSVSSIGIANLSSGIGILNDLKGSLMCTTNRAVGNNSRICASIDNGITRYTTLMNDDKSATGMTSLSRALSTSKGEMSNEIFNMLKPAFLNSGCISESDLSNYSQRF